jgi:hypothetical protein
MTKDEMSRHMVNTAQNHACMYASTRTAERYGVIQAVQIVAVTCA